MNIKPTPSELERRRRLAVARITEGWTHTQVAEFLNVNIRTVGLWWARHRADPVHGLDAKPHPGAKPKLTSEQEAEVLSWFGQSPTAFGFANELWTAARVAQLIERKFGVAYNSHYLSDWLARRRITSQKPDTQPRERDPVKIARWLDEEWPVLKKKLDAGAHLTLIDEAGALLMPLVRRTLAPRGQTPILKHRARHREKVSLIAALTVSRAKPEPRLHFRTHPKDYVNNQKAADFVRHLLAEIPGELAVLWDGGPMHKGDPIRQLLAEHDRLSIHRLPPYCPDFNPVEYLWSWLKYGKLCNYAPSDAAALDIVLRENLESVCLRPLLLQGFWDHCELPNYQLMTV